MVAKPQVWRARNGDMFHDMCFEKGESRADYIPVKLDELETDDSCEACSGVFLIGITTSGVDEEAVGESDDDEDC